MNSVQLCECANAFSGPTSAGGTQKRSTSPRSVVCALRGSSVSSSVGSNPASRVRQ